MPRLEDVGRIAALRANGIGDLMFALPALEALRAAYPEAHLALLATPWHKSLLEGRPGPLDEVVVVPPTQGVREDAGAAAEAEDLDSFFARMRDRRFDLALQLHGGGRNSNPFVRRLGARVAAGLQSPDAPPLDFNIPYIYYQSEVLRLIEVVGLVGAEPVTLEPRLTVTPADREAAREVLQGAEVRRVAVLHPGAGDPRRRWPPTKFAMVGDALAAAGATVLVTGGPQDRALSQEVVSAMRRPATDLAGRLGLRALLAVLERSSVVVGNDSGPLHLAAAVGTSTVGVYWCGNLINAGPFFRARHRPQLSWRLDCPVCGVDCTRSSCNHDASFVADVDAGEVTFAALDLLEGSRH